MTRIDLAVNVRHKASGKAVTTPIIWKDRRVFDIDKVLDIREAASLKAGGIGIRYTCLICGKTVLLFNDNDKWFIEK